MRRAALNGLDTALQRAFVVEYLKDFKAGPAMVRAGGAPASAETTGPRMLRNAHVQALLLKQIERLQAKHEKTLDDYVAEDDKIAFSDMAEFATWGADGVVLRDSAELTPAQTRAVASLTSQPGKFGTSVTLKLHDKGASLHRAQQRFGALLNVNKDADTEDDWRHRFNLMGEVVRDVLTARLGQVPAAECMAELLKRYHDRRAGESD